MSARTRKVGSVWISGRCGWERKEWWEQRRSLGWSIWSIWINRRSLKRAKEGSVWVWRGGGAVIHHHQVVIKHQRQARYLGKYLWLKVRKETIIALSWQIYRTCKNLILYHCPRWRVSNILFRYSEVADNLRGLDRKWDLYRKELWLQCQMCIYKRELIVCTKEDSEPSAYD